MKKIYHFLFLLLCSGGLFAQTQLVLPAHSTTFSGNVRGYWFTSPTCFTITGLEVASEAGAGTQNIAVIRLPAPPPIFAATTNVFTTLFLTQNNPATGVIPVNIQVETGDYIMVLGQRGNVNSYSASGTFTTTINGQSTTIARCGMQFPLGTTAPTQLWAQASGSISRVNMYYDSVLTFNVTATPTGPSAYSFTDGSDSSFTTVWNYGDGSPLDTNWTGNHTYTAGGTYNACSYVTTSCGVDTVCTTVTVCGPDPVSAFGAVPTGFDVQFADSSSNAVSWLWDFGDGSSDTTANPMHTYSAIGWYTVCLITTNSCSVGDTICDSVFVCTAPMASMGYTMVGNDTLIFSDSSMYATSWWWDFGDGGTDTTQNPMHTYTTDGTFNICLITTNACGSDTVCTSVTICVTPLSAAFGFTSNQFSYAFTGNPSGVTSFAWTFGDGGTSTLASPTHTYTANGTYVVCLTVGNDCGDSDVTCDTLSINIVGLTPSMPGFEITVAPHPVVEQAIVMVQNTGVQGDYSLELVDLRGAVVLATRGQVNQPFQLQVGTLARGLYVFRISQEGNLIGTGKLIVE